MAVRPRWFWSFACSSDSPRSAQNPCEGPAFISPGQDSGQLLDVVGRPSTMLCVMALERHGVMPGADDVLVIGAAGGVGSAATALLDTLGYDVAAVTGRVEESDHLVELGAGRILPRV